MDQRGVLIVSVVLGLAVGAFVLTQNSHSVSTAAPGRAQAIPEDAVWVSDAFGSPRWVHCESGGKVICTAFSPSGTPEVIAAYVARDKDPPTAPFTDIIARDIERVWINKVAMVPTDTVEFKVDGVSVAYKDGVRRGEPR